MITITNIEASRLTTQGCWVRLSTRQHYHVVPRGLETFYSLPYQGQSFDSLEAFGKAMKAQGCFIVPG